MNELYTMHALQGGVTVVKDFDVVEENQPLQPCLETECNAQQIMRFSNQFSIDDMELAQAYVRPQPLEGIYTPEEGLRNGTAFPNLYQPYKGRVSCKPCETNY